LECDTLVVGGGVLGVAVSHWLSSLYDCSIVLIEKESEVATQTTRRNTGLVHRPYYLNPEKKRLWAWSAEKSFHLWKRLSSKFGLPWNEVGTLMVATEDSQGATLRDYARWGVENGMSRDEYQLLDDKAVARAEPEVRCAGAILSRRDTSTDYEALTRAVWGMASENGVKLLASASAKKIEERGGKVVTSLADGRDVTCGLLINAAGGRSLDIAHMMGLAREYTDLHFRGEYWALDEASAPRVSRNIYSVARHREFPFLDPHFVIRADGRREVGPNAVLVAGPETYEGFGGAWGLASKIVERPLGPKARLFTNGEFLSLVWDEWRSSLSKNAMCERVRRFMPSLKSEMLSARGLAGVRSSLIGREGFVEQALVIKGPASLHVLNFNSPGATGAPVFSANVVRELEGAGYLEGYARKPKKQPLWHFEETRIE
jgi:L-2-hydroxyglutarate oxidase